MTQADIEKLAEEYAMKVPIIARGRRAAFLAGSSCREGEIAELMLQNKELQIELSAVRNKLNYLTK